MVLAPPPPNFTYEGVPFTTFGHSEAISTAVSFGVGVGSGGASTAGSTWGARVARRLGMTYSNRNVGATSLMGTARLALSASTLGSKWNPGNGAGKDRGIVALDIVRNQAFFYGQGDVPTAVALFKDGLRTLLRLLRASIEPLDVDATATYNGTGVWQTTTDPNGAGTPAFYHGGSQTFSDTGFGATRANITIPSGADMVVCASRVGVDSGVTGTTELYKQSTFVSSANPGPLLGTLTVGGGLPAAQRAGEVFGATAYATSVLLPGIGQNAVVAMNRSGRSYVDCRWATCTNTGNDFPPKVFVMHAGRIPSSDIPNAAIDAFNTAVTEVCAEAEFSGYCYAVPLVGWDESTCMHVNSHPNDFGQEIKANALMYAILANIPDYTEGPHILH